MFIIQLEEPFYGYSRVNTPRLRVRTLPDLSQGHEHLNHILILQMYLSFGKDI